MRIKKDSIILFYLISFISFICVVFLYVPRPKLNKTLSISNNKLTLSKSNIRHKLNRKLKRKINIDEGYLVFINNEISYQLTPISLASKYDMKFSDYAINLPQLFINADKIYFLNNNNYGISRFNSNNKYQTCLFDLNDPLFLYNFETVENQNNYEKFDKWISKIKRELMGNIHKNNINCLLITTYNPTIFESKKNIIKYISKNFIYE